jgi:recombination protein RecA
MITVEEVMAQLSPALRKNLTTGDKVPPITFAKTPSFGLNRALGGGLPYGRQVLIWGNKSAGKSSFCLQLIALAQEEGKLCAWIDAEMSYDPKWATKLGVDTSKLIVSTARSVNDMSDTAKALVSAGVDIIVVDSITSLLPASYFEKGKDEVKDLENTKQIGAESKDLGGAFKSINYVNNRTSPTLFIIISQERNNITPTYTSSQPTGGKASKFYSSTVVKLFSSESDNKAISGKIHIGDKFIDEFIGRKVRWEVEFSKTSAGFKEGTYDFYFSGDDVGVDTVGDIVDTAEALGFLERSGSWYKLEDGTKIQGRDSMVARVREDLDLQDSLIEKVLSV